MAAVLLAGGVARAGDAQPLPGAERPSPGTWPDRVYRWHYNPRHQPDWLTPQVALDLVREAARQWEVCGVRMEYLGESDREPLRMDRTNVVGWRTDLPPRARGVTGGRARDGVLLERDIAFASQRAEFQRFPRLLKKVLVHEFGHAIGLTHPASCGDVMTLAASCAPVHPSQLPLSPTDGDLARCKALYP